MDERWAAPVEVISVEPHPDAYVQMPDGRVLRGAEITLTKDTIERIRLGYLCLNCFQKHEEAFPEECWVCHFPMREEQTRIFEQEFAGERHVGSRVSLERERERLREDGI